MPVLVYRFDDHVLRLDALVTPNVFALVVTALGDPAVIQSLATTLFSLSRCKFSGAVTGDTNACPLLSKDTG